jgi:excisionase family DNA binding protein
MKRRIQARQAPGLPSLETAGIPIDDRWLSVDEIAAYLGIKRDTVYKWIDEKAMPSHRLGRYWKFRKDEIDTWVRSGGAGDDHG